MVASWFFGLWSRSIRLRTLIIIPFVLQIVTAIGAVGYLAYTKKDEAINYLATRLQTELANQITQYLDSYLATPVLINRLNHDVLKNEDSIKLEVAEGNLSQIEDVLLTRARQFDPAGIVLFGSVRGDLRYVCSELCSDSSQLLMGRSDPEDAAYIREYLLNQAGVPQQRYTEFRQLDVRERPWYQAAVEAGQPVRLSVLQSVNNRGLLINTSIPAYDASTGELLGVFAVASSPAPVDAFVKSLSMGETGQAFVINRDGVLISSSTAEAPHQMADGDRPRHLRAPQAAVDSSHPLVRQVSQQVLSSFGGFEAIRAAQEFDLRHQQQRYFAHVAPYEDDYGLDWLIVTVMPASYLADFVSTPYRRLLLLIGLMLLGTLALTLALLRLVVRPLRQLSQVMRSVDGDRPMFQSLPTCVREVEDVRQMLTALVNRLSESLRSHQARDLKFATLLEMIPVGVAVYDCNGRPLYLNTEGQRILQRDLVDVPLEDHPSTYQIFETGSDRPYAHERLPLSWALRGQVHAADDIDIEVDGQRIPLDVQAVPVLDDNQQLLYAITTFQDITERRQAERLQSRYEDEMKQQVAQQTAALEASKADLQTVLDKVVAVISRLRLFPDGQIQYDVVSQRCEQLFGYTAEEFMAQNPEDRTPHFWRSRIHPDDWIERVDPAISSVLQTRGDSEISLEYRFRRKDGSYCWVLSKSVYDWNAAEGCWNATVIETDISDRKQVELALQESESRFRDIAQAISQFFVLRSLTGEFIYVSPAYEQIWGRTCESLYTNPSSWMEAIHPDDREQVRQSLQHQFDGVPVSREYRILRPDGEVRWIYAQVQLMLDQAGQPKYYVGFAEDISDRKRVETQLQLLVAEKDALLQEIQHRVKNNLQLILSMLNMQQRRITSPDMGLVLRDVSNRIRVISLVHDLLYQSNNQAEVNLARYVSMLVKQVAATYGSEASAIAFNIQTEPIVVSSKAASICGLIFNELLTNALKYAFPNPPRLGANGEDPSHEADTARGIANANECAPPTITIHISELDDEQPPSPFSDAEEEFEEQASPSLQPRLIQIIVADNGIGLPPSFDLATSRSLGLLLVQGFVDQLSGSLSLEVEDGTQFRIVFPHA